MKNTFLQAAAAFIIFGGLGWLLFGYPNQEPTPLKPREPIKELTIKERVELALAIPKSRTTFHDISAKDVPTVKCDSTTTDTFPADEDGPAFVCITYYLGSTEVDLFVE